MGMEFEFDGRHGSELGLYVIHDDGLFERQFGLSRDTNTDKIRGHGKPYLYSTDNTVLSGTLMFYSEEPWTLKQERAVSEFLFRDTYKDFISEDNPDIVYSLMFRGEPSIATGIDDMGYISVDYECDAPWAWTKPLIAEYTLTPQMLYDGFEFEVDNISNFDEYNAFEVQLDFINEYLEADGNGGAQTTVIDMVCPNSKEISIRNIRNSDESEAFKIYGTKRFPLLNNEQIYINMEKGGITSSLEELRYTCCNYNWITLERGLNKLLISMQEEPDTIPENYLNANCLKLTVRCKFPILR